MNCHAFCQYYFRQAVLADHLQAAVMVLVQKGSLMCSNCVHLHRACLEASPAQWDLSEITRLLLRSKLYTSR